MKPSKSLCKAFVFFSFFSTQLLLVTHSNSQPVPVTNPKEDDDDEGDHNDNRDEDQSDHRGDVSDLDNQVLATVGMNSGANSNHTDPIARQKQETLNRILILDQTPSFKQHWLHKLVRETLPAPLLEPSWLNNKREKLGGVPETQYTDAYAAEETKLHSLDAATRNFLIAERNGSNQQLNRFMDQNSDPYFFYMGAFPGFSPLTNDELEDIQKKFKDSVKSPGYQAAYASMLRTTSYADYKKQLTTLLPGCDLFVEVSGEMQSRTCFESQSGFCSRHPALLEGYFRNLADRTGLSEVSFMHYFEAAGNDPSFRKELSLTYLELARRLKVKEPLNSMRSDLVALAVLEKKEVIDSNFATNALKNSDLFTASDEPTVLSENMNRQSELLAQMAHLNKQNFIDQDLYKKFAAALTDLDDCILKSQNGKPNPMEKIIDKELFGQALDRISKNICSTDDHRDLVEKVSKFKDEIIARSIAETDMHHLLEYDSKSFFSMWALAGGTQDQLIKALDEEAKRFGVKSLTYQNLGSNQMSEQGLLEEAATIEDFAKRLQEGPLEEVSGSSRSSDKISPSDRAKNSRSKFFKVEIQNTSFEKVPQRGGAEMTVQKSKIKISYRLPDGSNREVILDHSLDIDPMD